MRIPTSILFLVAALCLIVARPVGAGDGDWTQWRGPGNTGCAADGNPPVEFSDTKNVRWKTAIPGSGYSSPIVCGDRIYLLSAVELPGAPDETANVEAGEWEPQDGGRGRGRGQGRRQRPAPKPQKFMVIALNRGTGEIVWQTTVREELPHEGIHSTSSYAPSSPVTDGEFLYVNYGSRGIYCLDLDGTVVWETDLGDMQIRNAFGEGASPALHGNTLVIPWDHEGDSFVVALDKANGDALWRHERDEPTTWATPVIAEVGGSPQVILPGTKACIAYDLASGNEVWRTKGLTLNVVPTPILAHGMVYLTSGFRGSALMAIKLEGARGDLADSEAVVWTHDRGTPYIPSPMLSGRNLYFLGSSTGILSCFDAITGEAHYTGQRLEAAKNIYASIVGAGGHVYICDREGKVDVIADGPEYKHVATNTMPEGINASPAVIGDVMYLRTNGHLYCIGE